MADKKNSLSSPKLGMQRDVSPNMIEETAYSFMLNGNTEEYNGGKVNLTNEPSNLLTVRFPAGFKVVGYKNDINSDRVYFILTNIQTKLSTIGYVSATQNLTSTSDIESECPACDYYRTLSDPLENQTQVPSHQYIELINDFCNGDLNLDINFPIRNIEIKTEKLGTTLYWADDRNPDRYLNVDDIEYYKYTGEIICGQDLRTPVCIDVDKLLLDPNHLVPQVEAERLQIGGNLKQGTYSFTIAYCDLAGNERSQYTTPTNPISIFDENNATINQPELNQLTNYAIKIKVNNLDTRFKYYKVVVIERVNLANAESYYVEGIHPTTDDTILYTSSATIGQNNLVGDIVSPKQRTTLENILAVPNRIEKSRGVVSSNNYLFRYGLTAKKEDNLQPVINLLGAFVKWQSTVAREDLYKSAIATSKYKGYSRDEVQPFAIRFYDSNGDYTANFPLVSRPATDFDLEDLTDGDTTDDLNLQSVWANSPNCSASNRSKRWQIYNTAVKEGVCDDYTTGGTTITENIQRSCIIEGVYVIPGFQTSGSLIIGNRYTIYELQAGDNFTNVGYLEQGTAFTATGTTPTSWINSTEVYNTYSVPIETVFVDLQEYIEDNREEVLDPASDKYLPQIAEALNTVYPEHCEANFEGDCDTPELMSETNSIGEITGNCNGSECNVFVPKLLEEYTPSLYPTTCRPFKLETQGDSAGQYKRDTAFEEAYFFETISTCKPRVFFRDTIPVNENCAYAETVLNNNNIQQGGQPYYHNYYGAATLPELLISNKNVVNPVPDPDFQNNLHKGALWFKVLRAGREKMVFEITKNSLCEEEQTDSISIDDKQKLRYTFYSTCSSPNQLSNADIAGSGIFSTDDGVLLLMENLSGFPLESFYVAIDVPLVDTWPCDLDGSGYRTAPPCGCFSVYSRDPEFSRVDITFTGIGIDKKEVYQSTCNYVLPVVNECDPIAFEYGKPSYWESTENYPDNPELYDSSKLVIREVDLVGLDNDVISDFEDYFTTGSVSGVYSLKEETNLQCKPIRHFKFPSNEVSSFMNSQNTVPFSDSLVFPLGVRIDNSIVNKFLDIAVKNNLITQKRRDSFIKYEILRGDNSVNKSVITNALGYDMYKYTEKNQEVLYANYPHNDLGDDLLHLENNTLIKHPHDGDYNSKFSLISPEFIYSKPALPTEMTLSGYQLGNSRGYFTEVDDHSKWVILTRGAKNTAGVLAGFEAVLEAVIKSAELLGQTWFLVGVSSGLSLGAVGAIVAAAGYAVSAGMRYGKYRLQWLTTIRDLGSPINFASMFVSEGYQNKFLKNADTENYLRALSLKKYLREGSWLFTDEKSGKRFSINNFTREESVLVSTGDRTNTSGTVVPDWQSKVFTYSDTYKFYDNNTLSPEAGSRTISSQNGCESGTSSEIIRNVASPYFTLKNYVPDQFGGIDTVKWLTTNYFSTLSEDNSCDYILGGTYCISRFTYKRKIQLFNKTAYGLPDKLPFNYSNYPNIGVPRFYADYEKGSDGSFSSIIFPDIDSFYNFDCLEKSQFYLQKPTKFYLYYYGIANYLVESEINCNFRYGRTEPKDQFYPQAGDMADWVQEKNVPIKEPNTFFYNNVYSMPVYPTPFRILDKTYSKEIWDKKDDSENGVIYSMPDNSETELTDPWLVYKPLDRYEFPRKYGKLISLKDLESAQILGRFENQQVLFNAIDNLSDQLNPTLTEVGTGGIFSKRPLDFKATDLGFAGSQHTDMVSTPYGHFSVDAKRGKIFQLDQNGKDLQPISDIIGGKDSGMKNWFRQQLPFKILKQFPNISTDNKFKGIGISMGWDARFDRVFITKKDYIAKNTECLKYVEGQGFVIDESECEGLPPVINCPDGYTYNPATQMCERTVVSALLCPEGYTYDEETQTCSLISTEPADCECTADVIATPPAQNINSGESTSINLTSTTVGTTFTWTVVQTNVSGASSGSGNTIAQTLTNTSGTTGTAVYTITPVFEDCVSQTVTVTISVIPTINFDVVSTDWGTLTTASAWEAFFLTQAGATNASVTNFSLAGGRVRFRVNTNLTTLTLQNRNITTVNMISIASMSTLNLSVNKIVTFDPIEVLPTGLITLVLSNNDIVDFNPSLSLPSTLLSLNLNLNEIVNFNPSVALPNSLQTLSLQSNKIVTFNPALPLPAGLKQLTLSSNDIITFNPSIALPNGLTRLSLNVNEIVTFDPSIPLPGSLQQLYLNSNNIVDFNPTLALPASLILLEIPNNQITVSGWNTNTSWIALAPSNATLNASNNIPANGITGTTTESLLLAKGWTIIP